MDISVTYERDWGLGWIAAEPAFMQRASHALAHEGSVWLVDPVDGEGLEDRLAPYFPRGASRWACTRCCG